MKTIGVLGGLGPQATMDFEARLHTVSQRLIPPNANSGYPPMIVHYCRHAPILLNADKSPVMPIQPDPRLLEAAKNLGALVDFIVIPSNTPHLLQTDIEKASGRKILSMIDVTLEYIMQRHWRNIGVLGFGNPIVYTQRLKELGLEFVILEGDILTHLDAAIRLVMEGRNTPDSSKAAQEAIQTMRMKKVDGIILGCTEIPLIIDEGLEDNDLVNPAQLLAEASVRFAMI